MHTPFFPLWRARLAHMGQRVARLRQQSLLDLDRLFHPFLPPALLAQADDGPNSRERVFTLRRTFFGFLYQVLNPEEKGSNHRKKKRFDPFCLPYNIPARCVAMGY